MSNFEIDLEQNVAQEYPVEFHTTEPPRHPDYHESTEVETYAVAGATFVMAAVLTVLAAHQRK